TWSRRWPSGAVLNQGGVCVATRRPDGRPTPGFAEVRAFPEPQNHARLRIIAHRSEGARPRRYAGQPPNKRGTTSRGAALAGAASSVSRRGTLLKIFTGRVLRNTRTREHVLTCGVPFGVGIRHGRATAPAIGARGPLEPPTPAAARMPSPRGTRRPLPQSDHCLGDLTGRRIGDRSGSFLEDEQPRPGDLARDRLAVANGEERVPAAVDDE